MLLVKVLDNFLDPDLYCQLLDGMDGLSYRILDRYKDSEKREAHLGKDMVEQIKSCYHKKVRDPVGFFDATVVKCDPGYKYRTHADHPDKLVSTVVYLHPDQGNGTFFLTKEEGLESTFDEIIWVPNRLVSWVNTGQRHMYRNTTDEIRCTLNIYQKKRDLVFKTQAFYE